MLAALSRVCATFVLAALAVLLVIHGVAAPSAGAVLNSGWSTAETAGTESAPCGPDHQMVHHASASDYARPAGEELAENGTAPAVASSPSRLSALPIVTSASSTGPAVVRNSTTTVIRLGVLLH